MKKPRMGKKIKQPRSAYNFFQMAVIKGEFWQVAHSQSAAQDIGKLWRQTPEESKEVFHQNAHQDRIRYDREMQQQKLKILLKQEVKMNTETCRRKRTERDPVLSPTSESSFSSDPQAAVKVQNWDAQPRKLLKPSKTATIKSEKTSVKSETQPCALAGMNTPPITAEPVLPSKEKLRFGPFSPEQADALEKETFELPSAMPFACKSSKEPEAKTGTDLCGLDSVDFAIFNWDVNEKDLTPSMDWLDLPFPSLPLGSRSTLIKERNFS